MEIHGIAEKVISRGVLAYEHDGDVFHVQQGHGKFVPRQPYSGIFLTIKFVFKFNFKNMFTPESASERNSTSLRKSSGSHTLDQLSSSHNNHLRISD